MKKLVVLRGHQGTGKSHLIKKLGLEDWTLSSDDMRSIYGSPIITPDGRITINHDDNLIAMKELRVRAEARMARGETLLIDTTSVQASDISGPKKMRTDSSKSWQTLAHEYRYEVAYVDFTDIPVELAIERQKDRAEHRAVPAENIRRFHKILKDNPIELANPNKEVIINADLSNSHIKELSNWLKEPILNLSKYKEIIHIGDLQGCCNVLIGENGPLVNGLRGDTFYIFIGDLLDRGIENGDIMRWFIDNALNQPNVALIYGNHEKHLHLWSRGKKAVSNEFLLRTLPQLKRAGITQKDADNVCEMAKDFLRYTYKGREVFANHAGLGALPKEPWKISTQQYSSGPGYWSSDIDTLYGANTNNVYQVHGHRNPKGLPVRANSMSFNLENNVEHGGMLRTCTLSDSGWSEAEYANKIYRPLKDRLKLRSVMSGKRLEESKIYPSWTINDEPSEVIMNADLLSKMKNHEGVRESGNKKFPHIVSFNFTKDVFFKKSWDDVVIKARGLFINNETSEITGRGYDKFYNLNETEDTKMDNLLANLTFPITLYRKENGFLGNLGYDSKTDSLMIASKSTTDSVFARWFSDILHDRLGDVDLHKLKRYLSDNEAAMPFEVIDPVNDPHIIKYEDSNIVLLDVVKRTSDFKRASYETLQAVGKRFNLDVKKKSITFNNKTQFASWYENVKGDLTYKCDGSPIEGFVIEDAKGFMTKWKSPYYAFWKKMRSQHHRVRKSLGSPQLIKNAADGIRGTEWMSPEMIELAVDFNGWMIRQNKETIGEDIIEARDIYTKKLENKIYGI